MKNILIILMVIVLTGCSNNITTPDQEPCEPTETTYHLYFASYGDTRYERPIEIKVIDRDMNREEFIIEVAQIMEHIRTYPEMSKIEQLLVKYYTFNDCTKTRYKNICCMGEWKECEMDIHHDHQGHCDCEHCITCQPYNHAGK